MGGGVVVVVAAAAGAVVAVAAAVVAVAAVAVVVAAAAAAAVVQKLAGLRPWVEEGSCVGNARKLQHPLAALGRAEQAVTRRGQNPGRS